MTTLTQETLISDNLFLGSKVRLKLNDPEAAAQITSRWERNSTYDRLLNTGPAVLFSPKKFKEWFEKIEPDDSHEFIFHVHTLEDDRWIGFVDLYVNDWISLDTWVGIGIGEPDLWGQGYGSDALKTMLRYAFLELGLHAVKLGVFGYNSRAVRSYEKVGFQMCGRERERLNRDAKHADVLYMIVRADDWLRDFGPAAGCRCAESLVGESLNHPVEVDHGS